MRNLAVEEEKESLESWFRIIQSSTVKVEDAIGIFTKRDCWFWRRKQRQKIIISLESLRRNTEGFADWVQQKQKRKKAEAEK